jgi:hypothetical protein
MDFGEVCRILGRQVTTAEMGLALGASPYTVRQARLARENAGYRKPPFDWQPKLARLARARAKELLRLADRLEKADARGD